MSSHIRLSSGKVKATDCMIVLFSQESRRARLNFKRCSIRPREVGCTTGWHPNRKPLSESSFYTNYSILGS